MQHIIAALARDCPSSHDGVWVVDSTPVECGRSRETARRSDLAGWATYGYCASHSRYFWGLRLHLITAPSGLPIAYALTGAKATAAAHAQASPRAYCNESSHSPQQSGTTKPPNNPAPPDPSSPTTTNPLELTV